jgi:serine/threonine protein kinase
MTEQAYPDALQPQYRLHWYTIERVLGQGGFGITYLARDTNLDQLVAIKEYLPVEVATRRPDATVRSRSDGQRDRYRWGLDRFIQEARTLARFDHPNIVRVHSVFEFNGTAYMVMRFEEGDNLASLLERRGTLSERDLLRILLPVLDGLELVHNAGFIHRDIKPDNIHIRADGSPVLLDFGSARHSLGKAHTLTILVAPGYAPFEQYYSSSENQGAWTDIYGLGATCYRAIAGIPPMDAITRSKGILGSTREVLVPARNIGSGRFSTQLLAAIDHALEFSEKNRPQSVAEWRREILGETAAASAASAVSEKAASPAPQPAAQSLAAPPAPPSAGATAPLVTPLPQNSVVPGRWPVAPIAWATVGGIAGAIAIAILFWPSPDPGPQGRIEQIQKELDQTRERLEKDRALDAKTREKLLALLEAQEEAKRRQEEQIRLAEQNRLAEEKQKRLLAAQKVKPAVPPSTKPASLTETATRPPPPVLTHEPEPSEPPTVVALTKPKPDPQAEQLKRGEAALARGEYEDAHKILTPLAKEGNTRAQIRLAEMYAAGQGAKQNTFQSYIWYSLAALEGSAGAVTGRDRMAARLQPAEIKQADRVVQSMRPR